MNIFLFYVANFIVNLIDMSLVAVSKSFINKANNISKYIINLGEYILPIINMFIFLICIILNYTKYRCFIQHFNIYNFYIFLLYISFIISCMIFFVSVINMFLSLIRFINITPLFSFMDTWLGTLIVSIMLVISGKGIYYFINKIGVVLIVNYIQSHNKLLALIVLTFTMLQLVINHCKSTNNDLIHIRLYKMLRRDKCLVKNKYLNLIRTININSKISSLFFVAKLCVVAASFTVIGFGAGFWNRYHQSISDKLLLIVLLSIDLCYTLIQIIGVIMSCVYYRKNYAYVFNSIECMTFFDSQQLIKILSFNYGLMMLINIKMNKFWRC